MVYASTQNRLDLLPNLLRRPKIERDGGATSSWNGALGKSSEEESSPELDANLKQTRTTQNTDQATTCCGKDVELERPVPFKYRVRAAGLHHYICTVFWSGRWDLLRCGGLIPVGQEQLEINIRIRIAAGSCGTCVNTWRRPHVDHVRLQSSVCPSVGQFFCASVCL